MTLPTALTSPADMPALRDAFTGRDGMGVTQVTDAEFEDKVRKAEEPVLVDFRASATAPAWVRSSPSAAPRKRWR